MSFKEFSSKVKSIYIELPDYTFSHGANDFHQPDPRFIGRTRIIDRLREILSNTSSKTGAYLVTGYRGMGKSSFVSKVVQELSFENKPSYYLVGRFLLLYAIFILLALLDFSSFKKIRIELATIIFASCYVTVFLFYRVREVYYYSLKYKSSDKYSKIYILFRKSLFFVKIVLWKPLVIQNFKINKQRFKNMTQFLYIICLYLLFLLTINQNNILIRLLTNFFKETKPGIINLQFTTLVLYSLVLFKILDYIIFALIYKIFYNSDKPQSNTDISKISLIYYYLRNIFSKIQKLISNYLNYNNNIYIKINFGYDDLREIDILRLVARNLYNKYSEYLSSQRKHFIWKATYFIIIFVVTFIFYFNKPINSLSHTLKTKTYFTEYFPSQSVDNNMNEGNFQFRISTQINSIKKICNYSDYLLNYYFTKSSEYIREYIFLGLIDDGKSFTSHTILNSKLLPAKIFPKHIDYLFILYFILFWTCSRFMIRLKFFNIATHKSIMHDLNYLNDRIISRVKEDKSENITAEKGFLLFKYFKNRSQEFPLADVREIENNIIEILDKIDNIPSFLFRPMVVFIFDELDKIEPQASVMISEKEEAETSYTVNRHIPFSPEGARERLYAIQKMLSNLKYFLTTAKAKFVFIAGREMFDASLADVSDRNYFVGSIFNDVIYVDSFLSDPSDNKQSDVSSMIEQYVCKALIPANYFNNSYEYNLTGYYSYLKNNLSFIDDNRFIVPSFSDAASSLNNDKLEKIIITIQHFIIYLTHTSNGSPKKLSSFFEKYIRYFEGPYSDELLLVRSQLKQSTAFLCFDEDDQYKIGLIHYLASPIIYTIVNTIKSYDDKLLYSAAFLIDHLFKFHRHGFSYRNLENAPELIETNKTPELRGFISTIIQYMSQIYIQELNSGLYDFKFNRRISQEISYLSKISEDASAAFNFTLDESQLVKLFYNRTLKRLSDKYKNHTYAGKLADYIRSIAMVHMILGDLHFYDDEYNEAIMEYQDAIQFIRDLEPKTLTISLIILLIRNMLKLGLAYEKRKTYDSAFLVFTELANILLEYRNINLSDLGLEEYINPNKTRIFVKTTNPQYTENFYSEIQARPTYLTNSFSESEENLINILTKNITPLKETILNKIAAFEGLRLIYQPLLAKLQILEKSHLGGITKTDIDRLDAEFNYLQRTISKNDKAIMSSEFYSKVGNILFYKNGALSKFEEFKDNPFAIHCKKTEKYNKELFGCSTACSACHYYHKSLANYIKYYNTDETNDILINKLLIIRENKTLKNYSASNLKILAGILSDLGDTYVSCSDRNQSISLEFLIMLLDIIKEEIDTLPNKYEKIKKHDKTKLEEALLYYYLSAYFYKKADEYKLNTWQYTKILYIIDSYITLHKTDKVRWLKEDIDKVIKEVILSKIIKDTHGAYEYIHQTEVIRYKKIFGKDNITEHIPLFKLTINTDLVEPIAIFNNFSFRLHNYTESDLVKYYIEYKPSSPYTLYLTIYNKILRFHYKAVLNYHIFKYFFGNTDYYYATNLKQIEENNDNFMNIINEKDELKEKFKKLNLKKIASEIDEEYYMLITHLICDSIYCLQEIISSMNTYGKSYILRSSFQARMHESLAEWSHYFRILDRESRRTNSNYKIRIEDELAKLIGVENLVFINSGYQCEKSINLYYAAIETHNEGRAYRDMIDSMSFLNDDFNDKTYHFFACQERYKISTGHIKEKISKLSKMYRNSSIYNLDYYNFVKPDIN